MKKIVILVFVTWLLVGSALPGFTVDGPAPNSGDGISDGSGMDRQNGPNSDTGEASGPAPNSGDGIPDGSGM